MPFDSLAWLFFVGLGTAAFGAILGMTSGVFIVPILTIFAHLDIHTAIGVSLVSLIACSCGSAGPFLRARLTNVRLAVILETAIALGGTCGLLLAGSLSSRLLFLIFAAVLAIAGWQMFTRVRGPRVQTKHAGHCNKTLDAIYPKVAGHAEVPYRVEHLPLGLLLLFGAGILSSLLGIASGVLKVPAMDVSLHLPIKVSTATSSFMISVAATAGAGGYFLRGEIQTMVVAPIAVGSVLGTVLGVRALLRISDSRLRMAIVAVLMALAMQMLLIGFGVRAGSPL